MYIFSIFYFRCSQYLKISLYVVFSIVLLFLPIFSNSKFLIFRFAHSQHIFLCKKMVEPLVYCRARSELFFNHGVMFLSKS